MQLFFYVHVLKGSYSNYPLVFQFRRVERERNLQRKNVVLLWLLTTLDYHGRVSRMVAAILNEPHANKEDSSIHALPTVP